MGFEFGDIVTRDGTDEHLIYLPVDNWGNIDVVCIKEPSTRYIKLGETESNLERRYNFIRRSINCETLLNIIGRNDLIMEVR